MKIYDRVETVHVGGDEDLISKIAGISRGSKSVPSVTKLYKWGHFSPFEFASMTFKISCPIFVARQIMRHRTGSYMERSLRYCKAGDSFFAAGDSYDVFVDATKKAKASYELLIEEGVPYEQARAVLPLGTHTEFYMKMDVRNLINFFKLRLAKDAQSETREYAQAMFQRFSSHFPKTSSCIVNDLEGDTK